MPQCATTLLALTKLQLLTSEGAGACPIWNLQRSYITIGQNYFFTTKDIHAFYKSDNSEVLKVQH